jgi:hypothetical protein
MKWATPVFLPLLLITKLLYPVAVHALKWGLLIIHKDLIRGYHGI